VTADGFRIATPLYGEVGAHTVANPKLSDLISDGIDDTSNFAT